MYAFDADVSLKNGDMIEVYVEIEEYQAPYNGGFEEPSEPEGVTLHLINNETGAYVHESEVEPCDLKQLHQKMLKLIHNGEW